MINFESIVQEWRDRIIGQEEAFNDFLREEGWKEYDFTKDTHLPWDKLDDACKTCIFNHINKYQNTVTSDGSLIGNKFTIPCRGIPKDYIDEETYKYLEDELGITRDSEEAKEFLSSRDPVTWIKNNCFFDSGQPFIPRWYQNVLVRCTSKRLVSRLGRRSGKCQAEGTLIMTPNGVVEIQNLQPGQIVYAYNVKKNLIEEVPVKEVFYQGKKEVVDLINHNKKLGSFTLDHQFLFFRESTRKTFVGKLGDYKKGDYIVRRFVDTPMGQINEPQAYLLGAMLGDGCCKQKSNTRIYISSNDEAVVSKVATSINATYKKNGGKNYTWCIEGKPNKYYDLWCRDKYAHEKIVDLEVIKTWNRKSCIAFLAGLMDTDGSLCISNKMINIRIGMQAKLVIDAIKYLFLSLFQYEANITIDKRDKYKNGPIYNIGFRNNLFGKRILKELDSELVVERKKWKKEYELLIENNTNPDYIGIHFDIDKKYITDTYDIEIDTEDHLFLTAHGLVTHNSLSWAGLMLFYCLTQPFFERNPDTGEIVFDKNGKPIQQKTKILCVTPRQTHSDNLMKSVLEFINNNPLLKNSLKKKPTSSPYYEIEFSNGSSIICITGGTGTSGAGLSIRSFSADVLILDEANYLGEPEMVAARAILSTNINTILRASSTPMGMQDFFWEWCFTKPGFSSFHFPTAVVPHWNMIKEEIYQDVASLEEFNHEYMAEFSASGFGVFNPEFVNKAIKDYTYESLMRKDDYTYSIGVDWNKHVGTEIYIVGFHNINKFYQVFANINIPKSEWTQLKGVEELINQVKYWQPAVVIVDEGYGHASIELIRRYSMEYGHTNRAVYDLQDTLITYNFSSKLEIADPINGTIKKKAAKPFLVDNTVKRFEEENIIISYLDKALKDQLLNYIEDYRTSTGIPVYKMAKEGLGDHKLDAFMLAIMGFKLKFGELDRRHFTVTNTGFLESNNSSFEQFQTRGLSDDLKDMIQPFGQNQVIYTPPKDNKVYSIIPSRTNNLFDNKHQSSKLSTIKSRTHFK